MKTILFCLVVSATTFVAVQTFNFGDYPYKEVTVSSWNTEDLVSYKVSALIEVPPRSTNQDWVEVFLIEQGGDDSYMTNLRLNPATWGDYGDGQGGNYHQPWSFLLKVVRNGRTIFMMNEDTNDKPLLFPTLMAGDAVLVRPLGRATRLLLEGDMFTRRP